MSTSILSETMPLRPVRRWWLRFLVFLAFATIAIFSRAVWHKKVFFSATMAAWAGSYPVARIKGERFERLMFIMFVPARVKRWSLDRFTGVQTECEPQDEYAFGWWWFFGNWWVVWIVFDWIVPWLGGSYKLYLRAGSGKRVLAWQGNSESQFRANLDILQRRAGLSLEA